MEKNELTPSPSTKTNMKTFYFSLNKRNYIALMRVGYRMYVFISLINFRTLLGDDVYSCVKFISLSFSSSI